MTSMDSRSAQMKALPGAGIRASRIPVVVGRFCMFGWRALMRPVRASTWLKLVWIVGLAFFSAPTYVLRVLQRVRQASRSPTTG